MLPCTTLPPEVVVNIAPVRLLQSITPFAKAEAVPKIASAGSSASQLAALTFMFVMFLFIFFSLLKGWVVWVGCFSSFRKCLFWRSRLCILSRDRPCRFVPFGFSPLRDMLIKAEKRAFAYRGERLILG